MFSQVKAANSLRLIPVSNARIRMVANSRERVFFKIASISFCSIRRLRPFGTEGLRIPVVGRPPGKRMFHSVDAIVSTAVMRLISWTTDCGPTTSKRSSRNPATSADVRRAIRYGPNATRRFFKRDLIGAGCFILGTTSCSYRSSNSATDSTSAWLLESKHSFLHFRFYLPSPSFRIGTSSERFCFGWKARFPNLCLPSVDALPNCRHRR